MTEEEKYLGIYSSPTHAHYGHSNHGAFALDMVAAWTWQRGLDVGCGHNEWAQEMRRRHPAREVIGIDFACPSADVRMDVTTGLPWPDKHFDVLTAFDVLEHLRPEDVARVLSEFARVSRRFVFTIAHRPSLNTWQGQPLHLTVEPPEWWQARIREAGGTGIRCDANGCWIGEWQREKTRKLADLGKSWCLVGNGPSILQVKGADIDAHDVVVRFNNYVTRGYEAHTGTKTSLWAWAGNGMRPECGAPEGLCVHGLAGVELPCLHTLPRSFYDALRDELRDRAGKANLLPSCGYVVCRWLLDNGIAPKVSLAGFDHFNRAQHEQHHYWQPGRFKAPVEHDGTQEAALLLELHSERITYLSYASA